MSNLEKNIIMALDKGRKNWIEFISNLNEEEVARFYCNLYNRRFGCNYTDEYILRGRSTETVREELLNMNYSADAPRRLARAIVDYKNENSNYSFSYITGLGYPDDVIDNAPTLKWLETPEGFSWACYHL